MRTRVRLLVAMLAIVVGTVVGPASATTEYSNTYHSLRIVRCPLARQVRRGVAQHRAIRRGPRRTYWAQPTIIHIALAQERGSKPPTGLGNHSGLATQ